MDIYREIKRLLNYGLEKNLIETEDEIYVRNKILNILGLYEYEEREVNREELDNPQDILNNILHYAFGKGILVEDTITYRDLLDTEIMDSFMPRPSEVVKKFYKDFKMSPMRATKNYYEMSKASNYIRSDRINKNISWSTNSNYGVLDITINLSKPEKDPKVIAAAKLIKDSNYPECLLCKENEGYSGRINHPARQNHRIIPIELSNERWYLQYSPYVYYNEHCIVFKDSHVPMKITKDTFKKLLQFINIFPHYFIGSNADLPIVGGSILSHDHFQGGNYEFAMERATLLKHFSIKGFQDVEVGIVKWPMSVIRMKSENQERLVDLGSKILNAWKAYSDESVNIIARTDNEFHNTITPIARYKNNKYELDLVLRNNRTSTLYPHGIFHPHSDVHNIKKENIGLIEVMGLAVLPARLKRELALLEDCLLGIKFIEDYKEIYKHKKWFYSMKDKYKDENLDWKYIFKNEIGKIFERILEDAGVFKQNPQGLDAFERFILSIGE
jgi:UDPglucose--hexose-1-phosphate uridylyltransferase